MRGLPADDRPPLGQQLWQRGVDRGRRLSFAFVGPDLGAVKIRLDIRTGLAWPGVTNSRTTDITGFRTTGNASIMAAGTSYTTTSVLEAGASFNAMMERRCASAMRCCWARIHECRSLTKSAIRLSLIRIGAEISTRPLGGLMRRYRFLMGLRVRCRWMPSISNDCPAAADRTDFGAPDFGAVD